MNKNFSELWADTRISMRGYWGRSIGVCFFIMAILGATSFVPVIGRLNGLLLYPLTAGGGLYFLGLIRAQNPDFEIIFKPFQQYGKWLWGYFRQALFVCLWMLLLIVPGIIAGCRYSMTMYIMLDHPEISVKDAMERSSELMFGHKLRFFGYSILFSLMTTASVFTLGIALIWLIPWLYAFMANFYQDILRCEMEKHTQL